MTSSHNLETWTLVVVYGPCRQPDRDTFVNWLHGLYIDDDDLWGILIFIELLKIGIDQEEISTTPLSSIILSVTLASLNSPSKVGVTLGVICKALLF